MKTQVEAEKEESQRILDEMNAKIEEEKKASEEQI